MNVQKFVDAVYAEAQKSGADEFQIEYDYADRQRLELFEGKIEKQSATEDQSLLLAVKKDGKIFFKNRNQQNGSHFICACVKISEQKRTGIDKGGDSHDSAGTDDMGGCP